MARNTAIPERERALEMLLAGVTPPKIARDLGLSRATVWRWQRDPDFVHELRQRRDDRKEVVQCVLVDACLEAVEVLRDIMQDPKVTAGARVKAAVAILERADIKPVEQPGDSIAVLMGELERVQAMPPLEAKYSSLG